MRAGFNFGKKDNVLFISKTFLMLEEFMEEFEIENAQDIVTFEDVELTYYFYKYLLLNGFDSSKTLMQICFDLQNKVIPNYEKNIPIKKEEMKQEEVKKEEPQRTILTTIQKNEITTDIEKFIFAGKAKFTIKNETTKNRLTFQVKKTKDRRNPDKKYYFISVLTGTDNNSCYTYMGMVKEEKEQRQFYLTAKSKFKEEVTCVKVFKWFINHINNLPSCIKVYHKGCCARCGKTLTVPESILSGFGSECIKIMNKKVA